MSGYFWFCPSKETAKIKGILSLSMAIATAISQPKAMSLMTWVGSTTGGVTTPPKPRAGEELTSLW